MKEKWREGEVKEKWREGEVEERWREGEVKERLGGNWRGDEGEKTCNDKFWNNTCKGELFGNGWQTCDS